MAKEITIQAILALSRDVLVLQATGSKQNDQTGVKSIQQQVSAPFANAGTNATKIIDPSALPLSTLGYLFVKNTAQPLAGTGGVDQYIDVSLINQINLTPYANAFAILKPQEFALIAVNKGTVPTIYARTRSTGDSDVGAASVLVCAVEI